MTDRDYYILRDKKPVLVTAEEWGEWWEGGDWSKRPDTVVAMTHTPKGTIGTLFRKFPDILDNGSAHFFDTTIVGGKYDGWTEPYCTWEQAAEGHTKAVEMVRDDDR